jgi:hypothetical protein
MAYQPLPAVAANAGADREAATEVKLAARADGVDRASSSVALELTARGVGSHSIQYRVFNASIADPVRRIDLSETRPASVPVKLTVEDSTKPWVVVVTVDNCQGTRRELFGAFCRPFP